MKRLFSMLTLMVTLTGCNSPKENQKNEENSSISNQEFGAFYGEDGGVAYDELSRVIEQLIERNDELTGLKGFSSIDVPSVRANVVILTTLISKFNGRGSLIPEVKISNWSDAINETFTDDSKWGYQPWPEKKKNAWRNACNEDLDALRNVM